MQMLGQAFLSRLRTNGFTIFIPTSADIYEVRRRGQVLLLTINPKKITNYRIISPSYFASSDCTFRIGGVTNFSPCEATVSKD